MERFEKCENMDRLVAVDRCVAVVLLVNALTTDAFEDMLSPLPSDFFRPKRGFHRSRRRTLPFLITTPPPPPGVGLLSCLIPLTVVGSPVMTLDSSSIITDAKSSLPPPNVVSSSSSSKLDRSTITPSNEWLSPPSRLSFNGGPP